MIEYISLIAGIETKGRILASMRHLEDRKEGREDAKHRSTEARAFHKKIRKKKHKIQLMKLKGNRSKIQGR